MRSYERLGSGVARERLPRYADAEDSAVFLLEPSISFLSG